MMMKIEQVKYYENNAARRVVVLRCIMKIILPPTPLNYRVNEIADPVYLAFKAIEKIKID